MARAEALNQGRASFARRDWGEAFARLSAADRESPLGPSDLEQLAAAARLIGKDPESTEGWTRAHQGYLSAGDPVSAARCAFWLGFLMMFEGERAQAAGWLGRAQRLLDEGGHDCVERGYLLLPGAVRNVQAGEFQTGHDAFVRAAEIAARFHDATLMTFALHGQGRALIAAGEIARGVALLDEAMVAVTTGEVAPLLAGGVYCSLIEACHQIFDIRRADEWTTALARWCASQPGLVPFRGECMVHRTQILELRGAWADALAEACRACDRLSQPSVQPAVGQAWYRRAELHRLRGEHDAAEEAYREASRWRKPQPGLALLRLAQGQFHAAHAAIRQVVEEARGPDRTGALAAYVEIALAAKDIAAARGAAEELAAIAARIGAPFLHAVAGHAAGAVDLTAGEARAALPALRRSWTLWRELDAPYEAARVAVRVALACRALGDDEGARLELDAARRAFEALGAAPDLAALERLTQPPAARAAGPLTEREVEVLVLVATGKTNRAIAEALFISEKTVARHVSNIFTKLDLSSRAAATAYAYQHGLV